MALTSEEAYLPCTVANGTAFMSEDGGDTANFTAASLFFGMFIPPNIAVPLYGYFLPILSVLVLFSSCFIVYILYKSRFKSRVRDLLTSIAVADALNLCIQSPVYFYIYVVQKDVEYIDFKLCRPLHILLHVLPDACNTASLWFTVILAFVRYRCVSVPLSARRLQTTRVVHFYVIGACYLSLTVHIPSLFLYDFTPTQVLSLTGENETFTGCSIKSVSYFSDNHCRFRILHTWVKILLDSLVPSLFLAVLAAGTLYKLRQADFRRKYLQSGSDRSNSKPPSSSTNSQSNSPTSTKSRMSRESRRSSWILLAVVLLVFAHEFPYSVLLVDRLVTYNGTLPLRLLGRASAGIKIWQCVTYPLLFLIYCCMGAGFRQGLKRVCCCYRGRQLLRT